VTATTSTVRIKWGLSVLDWRAHAIDEGADHPVGVYRARCGHLLMVVTALSDGPTGKPCTDCAALQFEAAQRALDESR